MRLRQFALVLLAVVLGAASSFASICDVSCSFAQFPSGRGSIMDARAATAADAQMNMAEGMDHSCCRSRDRGSAIVVPHANMFPDCALDPSLRPQLPAAGRTSGTPVAIHAMRLVPSGIDFPKAAETPPSAANSSTSLALAESLLSSVLRI